MTISVRRGFAGAGAVLCIAFAGASANIITGDVDVQDRRYAEGGVMALATNTNGGGLLGAGLAALGVYGLWVAGRNRYSSLDNQRPTRRF